MIFKTVRYSAVDDRKTGEYNFMFNAPKPWSKEELVTLFKSRTNLPLRSFPAIGEILNRNPEAVRSKWRDTEWEKLGFKKNIKDNDRFIAKSDFLNKEVNLLDKRYAKADIRTELLVDAIERSVQALPKVAKPVYAKPSTNGEEEVGLILSDLHAGHQHTLEDTGGISEYNNEILKKRANNLKLAVDSISSLHKKLYKISRLNIFCLGDIIAGMNDTGAWSPLYIADPVVDQMTEGFKVISDMIYHWLGIFDEINFYGIIGNHGRVAKQSVQKDKDNWDYVCYKFLETAFKDNPRVKFNISKSWWLMESIKGHEFLLVHGDYTNGGLSGLKGLQTFEQKMGSILKKFPDYTLAGHFHNSSELSTNSGRVIVNGSFIGSDVYSLRNVHAASKPEQKLFGINDSHGITWSYNINLDIPRK